ncbi:MAG: hypothetical protein K6F32_01110 [Bacilli bacterium]|nr:hypothetical protein [Bacilli bacterium]
MKQTTPSIRYFRVIAMCGHVGKGEYYPFAFAIYAKDAHEAASFARSLPRVKHHKKDAILSCEEIEKKDYDTLRAANDKDPYLKAKCRRDIPWDLLTDRIESCQRSAGRKQERPQNMKYRAFKRGELRKGSREFLGEEA